MAVAELFKDSKDLEAFEKALNDSEVGINNLDLDEDGEVDFGSVPVGTYDVRGTLAAHPSVSSSAVIKAGKTTTVTLKFREH